MKIDGFVLTSSPHAKKDVSIKKIMYTVIITLIPVMIASVFYFGARVLLVYLVSVGTAVFTEAAVKLIRKQDIMMALDGSAIITGILLAMTLPPSISLQITALGSFLAILLGKEIFGGLGSNIWNPALVGRAILMVSYTGELTTWDLPKNVFKFLPDAFGLYGSNVPDAVTFATPLNALKNSGVVNQSVLRQIFGQTGGCIGETSAILIIIGGLVLIALKYVNWKQVVSYIGTVFVITGILFLIDQTKYANPFFHIFSGGLMLGAFYMASDMVTSPYTDKGNIIFGVGAGLLVVFIRVFWHGYPEGVMYSILLMNSVTPIINKYTKNKVFGSMPAK